MDNYLKTYNDLEKLGDASKESFVYDAVSAYKTSTMYQTAFQSSIRKKNKSTGVKLLQINEGFFISIPFRKLVQKKRTLFLSSNCTIFLF